MQADQLRTKLPPGLLTRDGDDGTGPKAYLNYILFDRDFNYLTGGFKRLTTAARESGQGTNQTEGIGHERLYFDDIVVKQAGYAYIYFSNENESTVEVFFDDFKVEQIKSPVVQMDDYYPFGLSFNSYFKENATRQEYKYNGKEEQTELGLGWLDYGARMYSADLGRFSTKDPAFGLFHSVTPYGYAGNVPTTAIDHNGEYVIFVNGLTQVFGVRMLDEKDGYWGTETAHAFKTLFNGNEKEAFVDYANGEFEKEEFSATSTPAERYSSGYKWAEDNYNCIIQAYEIEKLTNPAATLNIVSHSQGAAFAEGIAEYISKKSEGCYKVSTAIHLQPSSARLIESNKDAIDTRVAVYTFGDLVANKLGERMTNADVEIRERKIFGMRKIQHDIHTDGYYYNSIRYFGTYGYKTAHGLNWDRYQQLINSISVGFQSRKNGEWKVTHRKFKQDW